MNDKIKNEIVESKCITDENGNYFFGYYDVQPWNQDGNLHLCHKVDFWQRMPKQGEIAEIGIIDVNNNNKYTKLAETTAWNFQQGSLLRWNPAAPNDEIIYNSNENGQYKGVILNIKTGEKRYTDYPLANVDSSGNYGLGINFSRLYDFRPGYGYGEIEDPYYNVNHPKDDGIFLVDLKTGKSKLVLSTDELWNLTKGTLDSDKKVLVNHINFNEDGSRFVCLFRTFPVDGGHWKTAVITANRDGSDPYVLREFDIASHYFWKDNENLIIYANHYDGVQLYMWKDKTHQAKLIGKEFFKGEDGHCSFSPDKKYVLYDCYWNADGYRPLNLYDVEKDKGITLGLYYSHPELEPEDIRCDLHSRWNRNGNVITFDSVHEGRRGIYYMDLKEILK